MSLAMAIVLSWQMPKISQYRLEKEKRCEAPMATATTAR